jgi:hypothetical protein
MSLPGLVLTPGLFARRRGGGGSSPPGDTVPSAFGSGDWSITPGDTELDVTILSLPADGGATITDIEYRLDGGSWVSSSGIVSFTITGLTNGTEYDVEIRAKNSVGVGPSSSVKSATPVDPAERDVFIFAGQSNMRAIGGDGDDVPSELATPNPWVQIWNINTQQWETYTAGVNSDTAGGGVETDLFGPEGNFARLWQAANPGKTCYIVKLAINSSGLNDRWRPAANDLFDDMEAQIAAALTEVLNPKVRAIFYEQGGTDALTSDDAAAYETNLNALISGARTSWGDASSKFIFGRARADYGDHAATVRAAQDAVAASAANVVIYYNDDRTMIDEAHWSSADVMDMGAEMYACYMGTYSALPDAFEIGDWSLTPGDGQLSVAIGSLPANNGAALTNIEYRLDGGSWVSSGGTIGFTITGLTNDTEYDVEIRAVNSAGVSAASDVKSATPEASVSDPEPPALANIIARYRGDSLVGSGTATAWNDISGNGYHLTAAGSPTIVASGYGSRTVARLPGGANYFRRASTPARSQPFTVVVIEKSDNGEYNANFDGVGANRQIVGWLSGGPAMWAGGTAIQPSGSPGSWATFICAFNGASSYLNFNGAHTTGSPGTSAMAGITVGADVADAGYDGDIAEVIVYDKVLDSTERAAIAAYVAAYYGS